jgi:hypothetical protein
MRFMTRKHKLILGVASIVLAAGAAYAIARHNLRPTVVEAGGVAVLIDAGEWPSLTGQDQGGVGVGGTLGLVGGRCLGIQDEDSDEGLLLIWPHGTKVVGEGAEIVVSKDGRSYRVGDTLNAGTETNEEPITKDEFFRDRIPAECLHASAIRLVEL